VQYILNIGALQKMVLRTILSHFLITHGDILSLQILRENANTSLVYIETWVRNLSLYLSWTVFHYKVGKSIQEEQFETTLASDQSIVRRFASGIQVLFDLRRIRVEVLKGCFQMFRFKHFVLD